MFSATIRCALAAAAMTACVAGPPHVPPVESSTTRLASSGIAGREYVHALYQCARDNLATDVKAPVNGEAGVAFEVRNGRFVNTRFVRASGNPEFDHAARQAVLACDGRIATPNELRRQVATESIVLSFSSDKRTPSSAMMSSVADEPVVQRKKP